MVAKALKASLDTGDSEKVTKRLLNKEDFEEGIVGRRKMPGPKDRTSRPPGHCNDNRRKWNGKELVACCIHRHSHRSDGSFHAVNCGAI